MAVKKDELQVIGKPAITEYETQSGVILHITPLNLATLRAIDLQAETVFPDIDPTPYQEPLGDIAFIPGQLSDPNENPAYVDACKKLEDERKGWVSKAIFDYSVVFPAFQTKENLIAHFKPQLDRLREIAKLPQDDYEAILFHIILSWNQPAKNQAGNLIATATEYGRVIALAIQTVALTPGEVTAGVRFFRPYVQ